jgi:hypothetical protein
VTTEKDWYELKERFSKVEGLVEDLSNDFYNHDGQEGLKTQFIKFITEQKATREARKDADEELKAVLRDQNDKINRRWNALIAIGTILGVLLAILVYLRSLEVKQGKIHFPSIPHVSDSQSGFSALSSTQPQDAGVRQQ